MSSIVNFLDWFDYNWDCEMYMARGWLTPLYYVFESLLVSRNVLFLSSPLIVSYQFIPVNSFKFFTLYSEFWVVKNWDFISTIKGYDTFDTFLIFPLQKTSFSFFLMSVRLLRDGKSSYLCFLTISLPIMLKVTLVCKGSFYIVDRFGIVRCFLD